MTVLAFDASTAACSACVLKDGRILTSRYLNIGLTHSQTLLPLIQGVLNDAGLSLASVDRIGVTVGPGSFTGIKIAVSTAKGLALPNQIPCAAISSLAALGYGVSARNDETVCAVEDARRGMLYNANFFNGQRQCEDRQIAAEELIQTTTGPLLFCGDGSEIAFQTARAAGREARIVLPDRRYIRAESAAMIADALPEEQLVSPETLLPCYLRLPQAERERLEQIKNNGKGSEL